MKNYLIIIRGIPGSGKTYFAQKINKNLPSEVIDPEYIKITQRNFIEFRKLHPQEKRIKRLKFLFNLDKTKKLLNEGKSLIWTQPWRKASGLKTTIEHIQNSVPTKVIVLEINVDPKLCWERSKEKLGNITFEKFLKNFVIRQSPVENPNFPYFKVSNYEEISIILRKFNV
jgi:adenylate kinase family enzyme